MVHLHKKTIKGYAYWYLREIQRKNGKPRVIWQKDLGTVEKIKQDGSCCCFVRSYDDVSDAT